VEVGGNVFTLFRQLQIGVEVRKLARQLLIFANQCFQAFSLGEGLFGRLPVLPEIRLSYLFFEGVELLLLSGNVKENSAARSRVWRGRSIPFRVLRCLESSRLQ
jgi:hypothetical protein